MTTLTTIAFDADDTLWQNQKFFDAAEAACINLLLAYGEKSAVSARMIETERRNVKVYGVGVKSFMLSMIETAVDVSNHEVAPKIIKSIIEIGRELSNYPIEVLPHVHETLALLSQSHRLMLITKGDLFDQERKLNDSGLAEYFAKIEIVSSKVSSTYQRIFEAHGDGPARAMMIGNSLKSDILPALEAGSFGVHIPHHLMWALEHAEPPVENHRFHVLETVEQLPDLIENLR
jgi:putative hydrolase of the HAD superfamily